jgi:Ca2+-binding RTX toxin-like protein
VNIPLSGTFRPRFPTVGREGLHFEEPHMTSPITSSPTLPINVIQTGPGDDVVTIRRADGLAGKLGLCEVTINGKSQLMTEEQLRHTRFELGDGNDRLVVDAELDVGVMADGGNGDDVLIGGAGGDWLNGGKGKDIVRGRGGDDFLDGGDDHDRDVIEGGTGENGIFRRREDVVQPHWRGKDVIVDQDALDDAAQQQLDNARGS